METQYSRKQGYLLAGLVGAAVGGILVAFVGRVFPKMMSQMMESMMANMGTSLKDRMIEGDLSPEEMCRQMMAECMDDQE